MHVPVASTVAFLSTRERARSAALEQESAALLARSAGVAELLRRQFGATEVWLFGSLVAGEFHETSDVDVAVRGVGWDAYAAAHDALESWFGREVDLVVLESATPSLVRKVTRRGIAL